MARHVFLPSDQGETLNVLGATIRFLCRKEDTDGVWSIMENVVPREAGPPAHRHPWGEGYYVIDGAIEFTVEGERYTLGAGDFLYAPANTTHAFRGVSDQPARMLVLDAPAHAEGFFQEVSAQVRSVPADLPKLPAIGDRHGLEFMPPQG